MRKAPAPGAEVAAVLSRARNGRGLIIPPTPSRPRTEGVAERMLVNAPEEASKSRRFFSDLIAKCLPHMKFIPSSPRRPSGFRGNLGWMRGRLSRITAASMEAMAERPDPELCGVCDATRQQTNRSDGVERWPIREGTGIDAGRGAADAERRH
jgi:hypothetical protein